jgi:hypothetical protein
MKYFITNAEKEHTAYHEFLRGKWDGETFWKSDSILVSDEIYCELCLCDLFRIIPEYDPCDLTEINRQQWDMLKEKAATLSTEVQTLVSEAEPWVEKNFETEEVFTIVGV